MLKWKIGDVTVTRVVELEAPTSARFLFDGVSQDDLLGIEWLKPHEEIRQKNAEQLRKMTLRWGGYTRPLLVDRHSGSILEPGQVEPNMTTQYADDRWSELRSATRKTA